MGATQIQKYHPVRRQKKKNNKGKLINLKSISFLNTHSKTSSSFICGINHILTNQANTKMAESVGFFEIFEKFLPPLIRESNIFYKKKNKVKEITWNDYKIPHLSDSSQVGKCTVLGKAHTFLLISVLCLFLHWSLQNMLLGKWRMRYYCKLCEKEMVRD